MSPRRKVQREQWVSAAYGLLQAGRVPADVPLQEICALIGVTKGSFYSPSHFPGGVPQLSEEVIARWQPETAMTGLAVSVRAIRNPWDRLRLLRAHAIETAPQDAAMRRWAASDARAAAAVARVDTQVSAHVTAALRDLGFTPADARVVAGLLVHAFIGAFHAGSAAARKDPAAFESLISILDRSVAAERPGREVDTAPGPGPGETVLYTTPAGAGPAEREQRRGQAQQYAAETAAAPAARPRRAAGDRRGTSA